MVTAWYWHDRYAAEKFTKILTEAGYLVQHDTEKYVAGCVIVKGKILE